MHNAGELRWSAVESVIFGRPAADVVAELAEQLGCRSVFVLAGGHLARQTDEIDKIARRLGSRFGRSWSGIRPHGPRSDILMAANAVRAAGADLIVTVGGGSVTDAGKIVPLIIKHEVYSVEDFEPLRVVALPDGTVTTPQLQAPDLPVVCVPTTLSGGEFNPLSGAMDESIQLKQAFTQRGMAPRSVVLDPAITVHTPSWLWLSTGVRSVDHAVETLASHRSNIFCDGLASTGLELLSKGLTRCYQAPHDLEARLFCQIGAWHSVLPLVGGIPMGASHAIGHVLGAVCAVPHGLTSCVMAPYVQQWNARVDGDRQRAISRALGEPEAPAHVLLDRLIASLGLPRRLRDVGVSADKFPAIAAGTMQDIWGRTNPRPVNDERDVMEILRLAA